MNKDEIRALLYEKYIRPTERKRGKYMGIEIEMPIYNLNGGPTDFDTARAAAAAFHSHFGFEPQAVDSDGNCCSATDPNTGDNLSFDCSYNNLELSMGKSSNLKELDHRVRRYIQFLNEQLRKKQHTLTGMGINPGKDVNQNVFIPNERYRMLERYLSKSKEWNESMYFHPYSDFGAFASASQVQLDVEKDKLISTIQAFSMVEPVKAVLFSNSILSTEPDLLCVRDMLWENSTHGINPHNVGMFEQLPETIDELLEYISTTSIFCTIRDGKYINFHPIPIMDYLGLEQISGEYYENGTYKELVFAPEADDLHYLRTYKFEDLTYRGTIEFRSVCCQPFRDAMCVAAFHAGLIVKTEELKALLEADTALYHHGYNATELRKLMNLRQWPTFVKKEKLKLLCRNVLDLAAAGLKEQQLDAECYLQPLYQRAETLYSPARYMTEQLEKGKSMQELAVEFSALL